MTATKHRFFLWIASVAVSVGLAASCGTDPADDGAGTDEGNAADGAEESCDPVGPNAEQSALLNEPVAADVEVIIKQPRHPGDPGPVDLP